MTRNETQEERADRMWGDLLQELRVMQTGVQLTAGFLLTLPFQSRFTELDQVQRGTYLGLVLLAGLATLLVLAPVGLHRRVSGQHTKGRMVELAHRLALVAVGCVGLLVVTITYFIFDVVVDRTTGLLVGGAAAVVAGVLLLAVPGRLAAKA